jgi:nucleotide-binding universal stress UspA family protein
MALQEVVMTDQGSTGSAAQGDAGHVNPVVIVGIDGGPGSVHVMSVAARLAQMSMASQLIVAHVVPPSVVTPQALMAGESYSVADAEAELFPDVVEALIGCTVPWTMVTVIGNPAAELIRLSLQRDPSAIVVGADTPGWASHVRRMSAGSVPTKLAHCQGAPVVIVPQACSKVRQRLGEKARAE